MGCLVCTPNNPPPPPPPREKKLDSICANSYSQTQESQGRQGRARLRAVPGSTCPLLTPIVGLSEAGKDWQLAI